MQEVKSIRPEIKGLFETVRNQALQYADAFYSFERMKDEFTELKNELSKFSDEFTIRVNNDIYNLKQKFENTTKLLNIETSKTLNKYSELQDLQKLQESYSAALNNINKIEAKLDRLSLNLKRDSEEFSRELNVFKNKTNEEISAITVKFESQIKDIVSNDFKVFEIPINNRQKLIENRVLKIEQNIWSVADQYQSDFKRIYQDVEILKSVLNSLSKSENNQFLSLLEKFQDQLSRLEINQSGMNDQLYSLQVKVGQNENNQMKKFYESSASSTTYSSKEDLEIAKLYKKISELENSLNNTSTKLSTAVIISVTSVIIAIVFAAISFIN